MSIVKEDGLLSTARRVLITGGAGFIGGHLSNRLLGLGHSVAVIDSMLPYYDVSVKRKRVQQLEKQYGEKFQFIESSAGDTTVLDQLFASFRPQVVVHLAAQAGVRYCEEFKEEAHANNVETTERLLKKALFDYDEDLLHFVWASSSSVYGCLPRPWHEGLEPAPEGVYANTKKRGEQLCREYAAKRTEEKKERPGVAVACLRFFTVYGPEGRPDMAPGKFMDLIHRGKPIPIFGDGSALRDFTFIDDIIQGIVRVIDRPRPFEIYNLGRGSTIPHSVLDLINAIETSLGKKALTNFLPPQPGDVPATQADISKARSLLDYEPSFPLSEGIAANARWFLANIPKLFVAVSLSPSVSSNILSLSPLPDVLVNFPESISGQDSQPSAPLSLRTADGQALSIAGAAQFLQAQLKTQTLTSVAYGIKDDANIFVVFVQDKDDWKSKDVIQKVAERISDNGSEVIVWSVQHTSSSDEEGVVVNVPEISGPSVEGDGLATFVAEKPEAITTANCVIRLDVLSSILSELKAPEDVPPNTLLSNIVSHALTNPQFYRVSTLPALLSSSSSV